MGNLKLFRYWSSEYICEDEALIFAYSEEQAKDFIQKTSEVDRDEIMLEGIKMDSGLLITTDSTDCSIYLEEHYSE